MKKIMFVKLLIFCLASVSCRTQAVDQIDPVQTVVRASETPEEILQPTSTATEISSPTPSVVPTAENVPVQVLHLELADPAWDGLRIPDGQQCLRHGGENPSTPLVLVGSIPENTDAIILEFSDRDFRPMDNGGHGQVGFLITVGTTEMVIPSIPGNTFDLPEDFFLVKEHLAAGVGPAGAYMPPCSGGLNNAYYVTVKAVEVISMEENAFSVLGQGILELGEY